jgi:GNAT superfamily N-acetyltransferase
VITRDLAEGRFEARATDRRSFTPPDGGEVLVREVMPGDAGGLGEMFARCSQDTIYLRFRMAWQSVPEWAIELLAGAGDGHRDRQAIVALEGEKIVGHAMYVKNQSDAREAEAAVVVEDGRRSNGVGRLLLSEIAEEARRADVEVLTCTTLGDNYRLQKIVCRAFQGSRALYADEVCSIRVPLTRPAFGEKIGNGGTIR